MPESIPAPLIIDTVKDTFKEARAALAKEGVRTRHDHLGWILSVPDTHQKSVLAALDKERALRVLTCSTEDEANAIAAGLWIGGEPVSVMIQHAGLYASINTLRGVAMDGRVLVFDGDGSLLMQLGALATNAGAGARNFVHLLFKNNVYHTSGAQEIPGGDGVDFVMMAKGAGYREAFAIHELAELKRRLPHLLTADGPLFVQLHTTLADQTPMTARGGQPFNAQVDALRKKLLKPRTA